MGAVGQANMGAWKGTAPAATAGDPSVLDNVDQLRVIGK